MAINKEVNIIVKETGLDELNKKVDNLDNSLNEVSDSSKDLNKDLDNTKKKGNVFGDMTGGASKLSPAIGGAISGMKSMLSTMWLIVANPLGAIIAAIVLGLTLLYKAFVSTNAGADKMAQIMSGVSAVIDVLRDRILKVGGAIIKFMSGDFKGAMADGKAAVSGFGAEVEAEFKQAADATKFLQDVEDAVRELGVSRAKLNRDLARSKEIITDETASYKDKKKAIDEVRIAEEKQTNAELENAKRKLKSIQDLNKLSDTSDEDLQKEADAQSALYALEEKSASDRRAIRKTELRVEKEEQSRLKEISDGKIALQKEESDRRLAARKEDLQKLNEIEKEFDAQREEDQIKKIKAEDEQKKKTQLDIEATLKARQNGLDAEKKANEERIKDEQLVRDAKFQIANSVFDIVNMFAKKGSKLAKGVAAAQATMNTYQGITAALAAPSTVPEPFGQALRIANAATIGVMGLMNVKRILSTNEQGSTSAPSSGGSAPQAPSFNLVQGTGRNQIAEGLNKQAVVKSYVVATDVTTGQSLDRNIIKSASL